MSRRLGKGKVVPVHVIKVYSGIRCSAPLILSFGARWRWVVNFMLRPFCPPGKNSGTHWLGGWVDLSRSGRFGEIHTDYPPLDFTCHWQHLIEEWIYNYSHPRRTSFSPPNPIDCTKPSTQIRSTMPKKYSSCRTTMVRISCFTILLEFGRRPWRSRGAWAWREDLDGFEVDGGTWTDWSWQHGRCLEEEASTSSCTGTCEDACWRRTDSEGQERVFLSPEFSAWFLQVIFRDSCIIIIIIIIRTVGNCRWWSRWSSWSSMGNASSLNCYFFSNVIVSIILPN